MTVTNRSWSIVFNPKFLYLHKNTIYIITNLTFSYSCSLMTDNIILIIIPNAVVCYSNKCKKPSVSLSVLSLVTCASCKERLIVSVVCTHMLLWNNVSHCTLISHTFKSHSLLSIESIQKPKDTFPHEIPIPPVAELQCICK